MPHSSTIAAVAAFLISCSIPTPSPAQGRTVDRDAMDPSKLDCAMLGAQPNAPISVEACEAMKESHTRLAAAASAPGGELPGDDTKSCSELATEMRAMHVRGVSAEAAAESEAAGENLKSAQDRRMAETAALAARQGSETAAASLAPNAVQGAVAGKHAAEQAALARDATREKQAAMNRASLANSASALELAASLQANPRFARILQLMVERDCNTNDGPQPR